MLDIMLRLQTMENYSKIIYHREKKTKCFNDDFSSDEHRTII